MLHDLQTGWRALRRSPLFTLTAAGSLALGIGACTVIFSVVYTLLLQPLPYPHPEELVSFSLGHPLLGEDESGGVPPVPFKTLRDNPKSGLTALGGFIYDYINLTGVPTPAQLLAGYAAADYFRVFGVAPRVGRAFNAGDCREASPPTVLLSDGVWRTQFSAAEDIVGQTVALGGKARVVIGVMPPGFKDASSGCEVWLPMTEDGVDMSPASTRALVAVGRLAGVEQFRPVQALLSTLSDNLAQSDPTHFKDTRLTLHPLRSALVDGSASRALWLLFAAVGCVLLVTCANVANLQLVRAGARRREVGVRLALGASRARILRLCLAESVLLAALGGAVGVLASCWGVDAVAALLPRGSSPWQDEVSLSLPVLGFAVLTAGLTGISTGLLPAWVASRQDPAGSLAAGGRGASEGPGGARTRSALVVAEIALALVLLAGAGLTGRSFLATLRTSAGLRTENVLMLNFSTSEARYTDLNVRREYLRHVLENAAALPGVAGSALTTTEPFNWWTDAKFLLPGQTEGAPETARQTVAYDAVNPTYFRTLDIPILQGRGFDERDHEGAPLAVVINAEFARRFFSGQSPLSKTFTIAGARTPGTFEIIGVAGDVRRTGLDKEPPPQMYVSYLQRPPSYCTLYIRGAGAVRVESLTRSAQAAVWQADPDQPIGKVSTLAHAVSGSVAPARLYLVLFGGFAAMALLLAVLGIYGTVAYSVNQRTREMGIRLALGARREDILRLVMGQGARLIALGLVVGLLASTGLGRFVATMLYGVKATDPATLAGVAAILGVAALAASYFPARRAMQIDPLTALRDE